MDAVRRYAMFIDGEWVEGDDRFEIRSPATEELKQSGIGRELGPHALDEYTEEKFVHLDLSGRLDRRAFALLLSTPPG
jgi:acyl-CoA reductase-like NAD-dependent aldehyde dehydrogenase